MPQITALGMIETMGLISSIEAADAGLKAADVRLLGTDYVRGGLVLVRFEGEVAAVKSAVEAGGAAAQRIGQLVSTHVIPRAMPEVFCMLASDVNIGPAKMHQGGCQSCRGCEGGRRECIQLEKAEKQSVKAALSEEISETAAAGDGKKASMTESVQNREEKNQIPAAKRPGRKPKQVTEDASKFDPDHPDMNVLADWRVVKLRQFMRKLPNPPMIPNEIRYANKDQLLKALDEYFKKK